MKTFIVSLVVLSIHVAFADSSWVYNPSLKTLTSSEFFDSNQVSLGNWTFLMSPAMLTTVLQLLNLQNIQDLVRPKL